VELAGLGFRTGQTSNKKGMVPWSEKGRKKFEGKEQPSASSTDGREKRSWAPTCVLGKGSNKLGVESDFTRSNSSVGENAIGWVTQDGEKRAEHQAG